MNALFRLLIMLMLEFGGVICASWTSAATVTFSLDLRTPGEFQLFGQASAGDNFGIQRYGIPLLGPVTSLDHLSPWATTIEGQSGFGGLRSADGATNVGAVQISNVPNNIVLGFGLEKSSFAEKGIIPLVPPEQPAWDVPLLIAVGTYDAAQGAVSFNVNSADLLAGVYANSNGTLTIPASVRVFVVPETGTAMLMGIGLTGVLIVGRRWPAGRLAS